MKNAKAVLAMHSTRPFREGLSIWCSMAGRATSRVVPADSRSSTLSAKTDFHLTSTLLVHLSGGQAGR